MKKYFVLFVLALLFVSCEEDLKTNIPGFQGLKDDIFWKSNDTRAYISGNQLRIEALTQQEEVVLNTISTNVGVYILGTTQTGNSAAYSSSFSDVDAEYGTITVPGPVKTISLTSGGTGYNTGTSISTTGGTGSGLKLNINATNGIVTSATISSRGDGYKSGDIVTVSGGNGNCKVTVVNAQNSNGEIEITEYDNVNMTVTGKFKFNAVRVNDSSDDTVVNFQYGEFYKVPVYPSL